MMQMCSRGLVQIPEMNYWIVYVSPQTAEFADKFADFLHSFKVKQWRLFTWWKEQTRIDDATRKLHQTFINLTKFLNMGFIM